MNIAVLMGSPNERGSTYLLADAFRRGAEESGYEVQLIDVAHARLQPCGGCIACGYDGPCVQAHYHTLVRYLNLQDQGMVLEKGCGTPSMTRASSYPQQARQLGQNL